MIYTQRATILRGDVLADNTWIRNLPLLFFIDPLETKVIVDFDGI